MPSPIGLLTSTSKSSPSPPRYQVISGKAVKSIFGNSQFSPFPQDLNNGDASRIRGAKEVHNDDIYNTSIESLVEYTSKYPSMQLRYSDFAYLRDVGVYPNNRLIIARRFASPIGNDLTESQAKPLATLISWATSEDFFDITFGETWGEAGTSFKELLNSIGNDLTSADSDNYGQGLGTFLEGAIGSVPLAGFTEGLQYAVVKEMGLTDNSGKGNHPLGNPNLIREAKERGIPDPDRGGSGSLECEFSVTMTVVYEQKFISGLDPTLVYLDIIQNVLTFATSDSIFQFNGNFSDKSKAFVSNLLSGDYLKVMQALGTFTTALISAIGSVLAELVRIDKNTIAKQEADDAAAKKAEEDGQPAPKQESIVEAISNKIKEGLQRSVGTVISKYKVKIIGVINSLTGSPSGPWHVTIGNPKRPIFSSGDLYMQQQVTLKLGNNLAFNDLPSTVTVEFTLNNARVLGAQEIFTRFNTGRGRSYVRLQKSVVENNDEVIPYVPSDEEITTQSNSLPGLIAKRDGLGNTEADNTERQNLNQQIDSINTIIDLGRKRKENPDQFKPNPESIDPYLVTDFLSDQGNSSGSDWIQPSSPPSTNEPPIGSQYNTPPDDEEPFRSDINPPITVVANSGGGTPSSGGN